MLQKINKSTLLIIIFTHIISAEISADEINTPIESMPAEVLQQEHFRIHTVNPNRPAKKPNANVTLSISVEQKNVLFNGITLRGLSIFQPVDLVPLYESYLGANINSITLQEIANAIIKKYQDSGYNWVTVAVPVQKIRNGIVRVEISEGYISRIRLTGDVRGKKSYLGSFFDTIPLNQAISTPALERAMLLLNDLPGIIATSNILAIEGSPKQFELLVDIKQTRLAGDITLNNRGSKLIGETLGAVSVSSYSAFKQFEQVKLTIASAAQTSELDYFVLNTSWPISNKGTLLKLDLAYTEVLPGDFLAPLNIVVNNTNSSIGVYHPLHRQKNNSIYLDGKINYYKSDTSIQKETSATDRLYTLRLRIDFINVQSSRYYNQFGIGINQSLHQLNKLNETSHIDNKGTSSTNKEDFSIFLIEYFGKNNLNESWLLSYRVNAQYANRHLPSVETFTFSNGVIGGAYDPSEIYGDHGIAGKTTIQYRVKSAFFTQSRLWLYSTYDIARVWDISTDDHTSAASLGIGFKISSRNFTTSLEIAKPLTRDVFLEGKDGDEARGFASIRYSF